MKTIKGFFATMYTSITSPQSYSKNIQKSFLNSYLYYFTLCIIIGVVTGIVFSIAAVPSANEFITTAKSKAKTIFPANVTVNINDGSVTTNVQEPYVIPNPDSNKANQKKNIFVIDTQADIADIYRYDSYVLLTRHDISYVQSGDQIRTYSLRDVKRFIINKEIFNQWVNNIVPYLVYIIPFMVTAIMIFSIIGVLISKMIIAVIYSLFVWLAAIIMRVNLPYKKYLQLSFYAMTPVLLLDLLFTIFRYHINVPFFSAIVFLIFAVWGLKSISTDTPSKKK